MLILAAALLFAPHYEVTLHRFHFGDNASPVVADANGNLYFISDHIGPSGILPQLATRVDPDGNVVYQTPPVVTGTSCQSGPLAPDSEQNLYVVSTCSFGGGLPQLAVSKLAPSGTILYTFPLPTTAGVNAMAVGPDGSVFLTGSTYPNQLTTTPGAYVSSLNAAPSSSNAFVTKVNAAGTGIQYATFLNNDPHIDEVPTSGTAIAVDFEGKAYVTGTTADVGFPTSEFAFNRNCNCSVASPAVFVARLNVAGSNADYSTFLTPDNLPGNQPPGPPFSISVNAGLQATVTGPSIGQGISTTLLDQYGVQVLNYNVVTLQGQTTFSEFSVAPDGLGNLLFSGSYPPANLPISPGAFSNGTDFVAQVRIADGPILYATRLPSGSASGGVLPDGSGGFLVVGATVSDTSMESTQFTRLVPVSSSAPAALGVANVAGLQVSPGLAPGEITSIYGTGLGPSPGLQGQFDANGRLPESLGGTEVYFNGVRAPLLYAGDQQVNAIVPFSLSGQTVSVALIVNSTVSNQAHLPTQVADPEIFTVNNGPNPPYAFAVNQDGSINSAQNPAKGGSVLTLFVSGAGTFSPTPEDGTRGGYGPQLVLPVTVNVSYGISYDEATPAPIFALGEVLYAGSAPTLAAGILQINVQLPVETYMGSSQTVLIDFGDLSGPIGPAQAQGSVWIAGN